MVTALCLPAAILDCAVQDTEARAGRPQVCLGQTGANGRGELCTRGRSARPRQCALRVQGSGFRVQGSGFKASETCLRPDTLELFHFETLWLSEQQWRKLREIPPPDHPRMHAPRFDVGVLN